jgi:DsbC/DsbD-like thiol-disulfide interchange protein
VKFEVTTSWLACNKVCVMGEQQNTLEVSTNALRQGPRNRDMQLSRWFSALPMPLEDMEEGKSHVSGGMIHISGKSSLRPIHFIGVEKTGVRFGSNSDVLFKGDTFRLSIPIQLDFSLKQQLKGDTIEVEGLLLLGSKKEDPSYVVYLEVDSTSQ